MAFTLKLFIAVIVAVSSYAGVFATSTPFHPGLIFVGKARRLAISTLFVSSWPFSKIFD
jgi:hypothetical protein